MAPGVLRPNVERMRMLGAELCDVRSGTRTLKDATNDALRDWMASYRTTHYAIGSVVGPGDGVGICEADAHRQRQLQLAASVLISFLDLRTVCALT